MANNNGSSCRWCTSDPNKATITATSLPLSNNSSIPIFYDYDYSQGGWLSDQLEQMYKILRSSQWTTNICLTAFLSLIFVCGLAGNILVLAVFSQSKVKHASTILIMGLAINDLIICVLVLPGVLLKEWYVPFRWDALCRAWELVRCATIPLSSLILMVVAIDRYVLICHVGGVKAMSVRQAKYAILSAAAVSVCHGIPPMMRVGVYQASPKSDTLYLGLCMGNDLLVSQAVIDQYWKAMTAEFLLVLVVVMAMYILVFRTVYAQNRKWMIVRDRPSEAQSDNKTDARKETGYNVYKPETGYIIDSHPIDVLNSDIKDVSDKKNSSDCQVKAKTRTTPTVDDINNDKSCSESGQNFVPEMNGEKHSTEPQSVNDLQTQKDAGFKAHVCLLRTGTKTRILTSPESRISHISIFNPGSNPTYNHNINPTYNPVNQPDYGCFKDVHGPKIVVQDQKTVNFQEPTRALGAQVTGPNKHHTQTAFKDNDDGLETRTPATHEKSQNLPNTGCSYEGSGLRKDWMQLIQGHEDGLDTMTRFGKAISRPAKGDRGKSRSVKAVCSTQRLFPRGLKKFDGRRVHPMTDVESSTSHQGQVMFQRASQGVRCHRGENTRRKGMKRQQCWASQSQQLEHCKGQQEQDKGQQEQDKGQQEQGKGQQEQDKGQQEQDKGQQEQDKGQQEQGKGQQEQGKGQQEQDKGQHEQGKGQKEQDKGQQEQGKGQQEQDKGQQEHMKGQHEQDKGQQQQGNGQQEHGDHQEQAKHGKQQHDFIPQKRYLTAQVKTAKVLLLVTVVYVVSFAPVLLMILGVVPSHPIPFYGYFVHSAANPLIYSFINLAFRRQLLKLLPGRRKT